MKMQPKKKLAGLLIVALCAPLATPAIAGAQQVDPTTSQYEDQLTQINQGAQPPSGNNNGGGPTGGGPSSEGGLSGNVGPLPFTGFDVIAMAAVALSVAGLGLALQRAVSRRPSDGLG